MTRDYEQLIAELRERAKEVTAVAPSITHETYLWQAADAIHELIVARLKDLPAETKAHSARYIELAHAMKRHGGSFAFCMGSAYLYADTSNRIRLIEAFDDLFQSYSNWLKS